MEPKQAAYKYLGKCGKNLYFSDSFRVKQNYEHYKEDSTRRNEIAALGT